MSVSLSDTVNQFSIRCEATVLQRIVCLLRWSDRNWLSRLGKLFPLILGRFWYFTRPSGCLLGGGGGICECGRVRLIGALLIGSFAVYLRVKFGWKRGRGREWFRPLIRRVACAALMVGPEERKYKGGGFSHPSPRRFFTTYNLICLSDLCVQETYVYNFTLCTIHGIFLGFLGSNEDSFMHRSWFFMGYF